ncbi:Stringent starvation protein A [compost metagenome]
MSITVFGAALSPFVRKVRLFLAEKGTDYQLENVQPFTPPEWYLELNPLGRIPAMRDGELTLADSSVICHYLEERNPELAPLCGEGAVARARVSWLEKYADYEVAPLSTFTVFRNRVLKPLMGKESDETAVQAPCWKNCHGTSTIWNASWGARSTWSTTASAWRTSPWCANW